MRELFEYMYGSGGPFKWGEKPPVRPRDLTDDDRLQWDTALNQQTRGQQRTHAQVREMLKQRNRLRWWGMQRDFKWLQREMERMGLNPEDARYLL